ncbi:MAG: SIMPL domain-containing protein [Phaeodactylibacter sp.]|uniref:SIMPL domain-containing protein n=1 Tax=Phaeodactylibacter sp. TaxID=1940289 RepID=UPI0032EB16A8
MKIKILRLAFFCLLAFSNLSAQVGGNQVYQNQSIKYNRSAVEVRSIYSTDSTLVVTSKVLLNQAPEFYVITIGVNSIAKTVTEANQLTNDKIKNVTSQIKNLGITGDDIYVDFISETKMYDHTITDREIKEYFDGFSIRKNLIIKTSQLLNIDKIIDYCAEQEIYDIVKVDYRSKDLEKINKALFDEAVKVSKTKTKRFSNNSSTQLTDNYRIVSESFKVYYPKNLYKQYNEAFETSLVNTHYSSNYLKKEVRKERTFYYDGIETEVGIDKIIDEISPVVGIQYVIELVIMYNLEKG